MLLKQSTSNEENSAEKQKKKLKEFKTAIFYKNHVVDSDLINYKNSESESVTLMHIRETQKKNFSEI